MRKLFIAGMMGAALVAGCGDEETEDTTPVTDDGGTDSAAPIVYTQQVTNVGVACADDTACDGDSASCRTELNLSALSGLATNIGFSGIPELIEYPGGYCTMEDCEDDAQCGEGSACVGAIDPAALGGGEGGGGGLGGALSGLLPAPFCAKACEDDSDCRADYVCITLADVFSPPAAEDADADAGTTGGIGSLLAAAPGFTTPYCLPEAEIELPTTDAGTDAGDDLDAGDTDAGDETDAGDTDAGDTDAGDETDAG